ncbi:MAG: cobaltochelatase subunit CobN, partial [Promethearchaeota archaeon]
MKWMTEGIIEIYQQFGRLFTFKIYFLNDVNDGKIPKEELIEAIYESDIMLIDIRGHCLAVDILEEVYEKMEKENLQLFEKKQIVTLIGGSPQLMRLTKIGSFMGRKIPLPKKKLELGFDEIPDITEAVNKGMKIDQIMRKFSKTFPFGSFKHIKNWVYLRDYWSHGFAGVAENHKNLILFLLKNYLGFKDLKVSKPLKIPEIGIYDPNSNKYFETLDKYLQFKPIDQNKQTIGLFFYGSLYFEQSLSIIEEFAKKFSDFNLIPVYSEVLYNVDAHQNFFFKNDRSIVSIVLNFQYFQLNGGPFGGNSSITLDLYKKMNVPHLSPLIQYDLLYEDYLKSEQGAIPINQVISIVMPELDGRIEMMTVGCMQNLGYSEELHSDVLEVAPIPHHIDFIVERVKKWLNLRIKENSEKKIAIIVYNYPPSEDKIGNAAYLDVSESIRNFISALIKEGYNVDNFPENKSLADLFIESGVLNNSKYTDVSYFKGVLWNKDDYLNYFNQLPEFLRNDVIKHWGPPPGKINVANSNFKLPILQLNNLYLVLQPARSMVSGDSSDYHDKNLPPHHQYLAFYRYLEKVLNIDAMIHFGTHGTVEFQPGKQTSGGPDDFCLNLIGTTPNLYYYHITNTSESAIAKRRGNAVIVNHAGPTFKNSDLYQELANLESLISEYQNENIFSSSEAIEPVVFKRIKDLEKDIFELAQNLNFEYSSIDELEDLLYRYKTSVIPMGLHVLDRNYTIEEKYDLTHQILLNSGEIPDDLMDVLLKFEEHENQNSNIFETCLKEIVEGFYDSRNLTNPSGISKEDHLILKNWVNNFLFNVDNSMEMENLIHGLEGGYIEPGLGGDPIRSPHIFPTGRNSYGFDPRLIPSSTAFKRGGIIAETLIENYKKEQGTFPETTSVVLWAFETMKTGGETIGQIFNYLGVRPIKNRSVWTTELEVIPLGEMKHPRINVIVTICGIFRDTFPYILNLLNEAVELVENLDEPIDRNFVRKSVLELRKKGLEHPEARIYGPAPGKYNTNLTDIISAGVWDDENELADDYINCMSFAYMKNQKINKISETFIENVSKINVMSQVRDSSEYHVTDLDHYFEFTGGMARVFKEISGTQANVYIADTTTKDIRVDSLEHSIKEGAVTRSLNPRWIKAMLTHKYHGGQKVAERVENILGFSATTDSVDNWIWDKSYDQYIENDEIRTALIENNRFAMMDIIKNMLQAEKRGYWDANEKQLDNLKKIYLDLENWIEATY